MMVILKIPVVYLCVVVWWAIRAGPPARAAAARTARRHGRTLGGRRWPGLGSTRDRARDAGAGRAAAARRGDRRPHGRGGDVRRLVGPRRAAGPDRAGRDPG